MEQASITQTATDDRLLQKSIGEVKREELLTVLANMIKNYANRKG